MFIHVYTNESEWPPRMLDIVECSGFAKSGIRRILILNQLVMVSWVECLDVQMYDDIIWWDVFREDGWRDYMLICSLGSNVGKYGY